MFYYISEIIGTVAFAVSGAMIGINKKMDIFGVAMLGLITAVGGGIMRDVIIGVHPPVAFQDPEYALIAIVTSLIVFLPFIRKRIDLDGIFWILADAIGLAVFSVVGVRAGAEFDNLFLEVFLGTITGVGGGVIRDVCAQEKPTIFVRHFYACASIIGSLVCAIAYRYNETLSMVAGISVIIVLRYFAAKYKWELPRA